MNADPRSAFRLSPLREPDARTRADRFSVRATSRTCSLVVLSKIIVRTVSASGPDGARTRVSWRFNQALYHLSYRPNKEKTRCRLRHRVLEIPTESGQVSQTQTAHGQRIRRLTGKTRINALFGIET